MIEVLYFIDLNRVADKIYYAYYSVDGVKGGVYVNIKDFYNWLKVHDNLYYKELRGRHFFFKESSIVEDFWNRKKPERMEKAKQTLDSYFFACHTNNGLPNLYSRIDLQFMSPLFQEVQNKFLYSSDLSPHVSYAALSYYNKYYSKKYGKYWYKDLIEEGKRIGYKFSDDGTAELFADSRFRTMFYDSGSTREMQFDKTVGRENTNGVK